MKRSRTVGIHNGPFHADEVTACALLILFDLIDANGIIRSRDPGVLAQCEFVCDVGGVYAPDQKLFDHHQMSYKGSLSSAGMVLLYLREEGIISNEEFEYFNQALVAGVDAHDNGVSPQLYGYCSFSHIIANFNPVSYEATDEMQEQAFVQALQFALGALKRLHQRFLYNLECQKTVKKAMERNKICLLFDEAVAWSDSFFALGGKDHPALFVVMPAKEHWKLRGIPPDEEHRMQVRLPLPEKWAGLLDQDLIQASGIEGAIFCHKGRFTSVWETREDALKALEVVLKMHGVNDENSF